jgi:hypothetical protein
LYRRGIKLGAADNAADAVEQAKAARRKANAASKYQELLQQSHKLQAKRGSKPSAAVPTSKVTASAPSTQERSSILSQKRARHDPDAVRVHSILFFFCFRSSMLLGPKCGPLMALEG